MVLWGLLAVTALLLVTNVAGLQVSLKITSLSGFDWAIVFAAAFVATFWMELVKILSGRHLTFKPNRFITMAWKRGEGFAHKIFRSPRN
jgi:hypothetical protein